MHGFNIHYNCSQSRRTCVHLQNCWQRWEAVNCESTRNEISRGNHWCVRTSTLSTYHMQVHIPATNSLTSFSSRLNHTRETWQMIHFSNFYNNKWNLVSEKSGRRSRKWFYYNFVIFSVRFKGQVLGGSKNVFEIINLVEKLQNTNLCCDFLY